MSLSAVPTERPCGRRALYAIAAALLSIGLFTAAVLAAGPHRTLPETAHEGAGCPEICPGGLCRIRL